MNTATDKLYDILESRTVAFVGSIASVLGLIAAAWQMLKGQTIESYQIPALGALLIIAIVSGVYSVRVRSDNQAAHCVFQLFHEINHLYRNTLAQMFSERQPTTDQEILLQNERTTLEAVCQRISDIYQLLIRRHCVVTVKLITRGGAVHCAETYVRSESKSVRDDDHPKVFEVKTGANTAFDEAIRFTPGKTSHFCSSDLIKDEKRGKYQNQRPNWKKYYKSAIVVPIRYADPQKVGQDNATDDLGYLCVDTKSRNRLKEGSHVQIVCAFADQMYNFMQLMRGKFCVVRRALAAIPQQSNTAEKEK